MQSKDMGRAIEEAFVEAEEDKEVREYNPFPVNVIYCSVCGYPTEYCEYSPLHTADPPAAEDSFFHGGYYKEERKEPEVEEGEGEGGGGDEGALENGNNTADAPMKKCIEICTMEWGVRKYTTNISGLGAFGIQPREAVKLFRLGASTTPFLLQQPINSLQQPINSLQQPINSLQQPLNSLQLLNHNPSITSSPSFLLPFPPSQSNSQTNTMMRVKFACSATYSSKSSKDSIIIQGNLHYESYCALREWYQKEIKEGDVYYVDSAGNRTVAVP